MANQLGILGMSESSDASIYRIRRPPEQNTQIKVEVFNACGEKDVAKQLTNYIRGNKVDVVFYGNYQVINNKIYTIPKTLVIDRKKAERTNARIVASIIGVKEEYVIYQLSPQRQVDVTVLIGKDYDELKVFK